MALSPRDSQKRRAQRVRTRLRKVSSGRPRLSVFRSAKNIYAQVIDDEAGVTLAAASSLEGEKKGKGSDKIRADGLAAAPAEDLVGLIEQLTEQMHSAAGELQFELAARLRDEVGELKKELRQMQSAGHA